jgi:hypothetical protein
MGGGDEKENLVNLTAREHFMCHRLLVQIHPSNNKLKFALWAMCNMKSKRQSRYTPSSRIYESIKIEVIQLISDKKKGVKLSEEHKRKTSETLKGRKRPQEVIDKIVKTRKENVTGTKWYHKPDGSNLRAFPNDPKINEEGWLHGRFGGKSISDKANKVKEKKYEGKKLPSTSNKRCSIDGVEFESAKAAADFLNMNEFSIRWILQGRGRSEKHKEKYKNWYYTN